MSTAHQMTRFFLTLLGLAALSLGACNTYDPDIGNAPFRCGTGSPRCPDDYECVSYSPADEVCERIGGDIADRPDASPPGTPDARDLACNNDSEIEPNESLSDPTLTGIPEVQTELRLVMLAICPTTDQDFFRFDVTTNATDATVQIEFQADRGQLKLDMLGSTGSSIGAAIPVGGNDNILRVAIPNLPVGTYYAHVRSDGEGSQNNYAIEMITSP